MGLITPEVLLISSTFDFSTDHVAYQLQQLGTSYFRLNRDSFSEMALELRPAGPSFCGLLSDIRFEITPATLRSIYFRAPVYLRDNYQPDLSADQQFSRSQWAAFLRSLTVFDSALWVNHPQAIYQAEVKPFQLKLAQSVGFRVPETLISNSTKAGHMPTRSKMVIAKTLDSVVLRSGEDEAFIYTNLVSEAELATGDASTAPVIFQQPLLPKIDLRVSVVGDVLFAVEIHQPDDIDPQCDWRLNKQGLTYRPHCLPKRISDLCVELTRRLGLAFGGIDLILHEHEYYFVEINPTGEWAWLMEHTGMPIDREIAKLLSEKR